MSKRIILVIIILTAVIVFGFWWVATTTERQITKTLETVAELAENSVLDSAEEKIAKSKGLTSHFDPEAVIEWQENGAIPDGELIGQEEISQKILATKNSLSFQINLSDIVVRVSPSKKTASATFNLVATQRQNILAYQANAQLTKKVNDWQITKLSLSPVLRK